MWRATLIAALLLAAPAQAEESCRLVQVAAFDLKTSPTGDYWITLPASGKELAFFVSLTSPFSAIRGSTADALWLKTSGVPFVARYGDEKTRRWSEIKDFEIGPVKTHGFHAMRFDHAFENGDLDGFIGLDVWEKFDVELDLKHARMSLFSQDHCPGKVVHWASSYAAVPLEIEEKGHAALKMRLDGVDVIADLAATEDMTTMKMSTLTRLFGVKEGAPGLALEPDGKAYRYPFKSLGMEGIAVDNPVVYVWRDEGKPCLPGEYKDAAPRVCSGATDLRLGSSVVKALHLYYAFGEKVLYVTAADAHG